MDNEIYKLEINKLNSELKETKSRQRAVYNELLDKTLELKKLIDSINSEKSKVKLNNKDIKNKKALIRASKSKIKIYNKKLGKIINLYTIKNKYVPLIKLKRIMGNLNFMDSEYNGNIRIDKTEIRNKVYIHITDDLYHVLFDMINSETTRYKLFKARVLKDITEIKIDKVNINNTMNAIKLQKKNVECDIKNLRNKENAINKEFKETQSDIITFDEKVLKKKKDR